MHANADRQRNRARYKIVRVRAEHLIDLLNTLSIGPSHVQIPRFDGLPDGYYVASVRIDDWTNDWLFKVVHTSFPEVSPGQVGEEIESTLWTCTIPAIPVSY